MNENNRMVKRNEANEDDCVEAQDQSRENLENGHKDRTMYLIYARPRNNNQDRTGSNKINTEYFASLKTK
ncbi:hypothetical protein H8356DRAFT_1355875 [Neocallimastix lanati (nom. inval.)]|nr:hypothetical protein H8356DRAFT_1355875 [Neocallimastix sp. JGI-2020a]